MAMQHTRQDAVDTAARRKLDQRPAWHPMLAAREAEPGVWYMVDTLEKCYGIIRQVRVSRLSSRSRPIVMISVIIEY